MRQRPCTGLSEGVSAEQMGRCDGLWRPPQQAQVGAGSDAVLPSRRGAARPCLRGQPCSAHRCGARPSSARFRGGVPARKRVCAGGEASRAAGTLYAGRGTEKLGPLMSAFLPSLSAPQCREPRRARVPPRDFLRGGSGGPEAVHGGRHSRGCPSHSKGGRRWATRPSTSTRGRRTTSRSSLAPYAATWWTHHCSPPATTSSARLNSVK